ncbi:MAG: trypsin-like serine protease [Deltaproteobacteria bacterium]|nr:trypsin-like serine protease [Deltaproteobacteria bacterium]
MTESTPRRGNADPRAGVMLQRARLAGCAGCVALVWLQLGGCAGDAESTRTAASPIVGGEPSRDDHAVVALRDRRTLCPEGREVDTFCSGVLVAPRAVLTAAHCLQGRRAEELEVFFGEDVGLGGGTHARVVASRVHPDYDAAARANDLAVVWLARDAVTVPLRRSAIDVSPVGTLVRQVGYGRWEEGGAIGARATGTAKLVSIDAGTIRFEPAPALVCAGDSGGAILATLDGEERLVAITRSGDSTCKAYGVATMIDEGFLAGAIAELSSVAAPRSGDPTADFCTNTCSTERDCPAGMACLPERDGARCGYRGPRAGRFGAACGSASDCGGAACLQFSSGEDASCRCFEPCLRASPTRAPETDASGGCVVGERGRPLGLAAALVLAAAMARRRFRF